MCAQSCLTVCGPMGCSPPGSSSHGVFQARLLEWAVIYSFRGSSWLRDGNCVSCIFYIGKRTLYHLHHQKRHHISLSVASKAYLLLPLLRRNTLINSFFKKKKNKWNVFPCSAAIDLLFHVRYILQLVKPDINIMTVSVLFIFNSLIYT